MRKRAFSVAVTLLALLLAACSSKPPESVLNGNGKPLAEPEIKIVDFQLVDCDRIWEIDTSRAISNSLYWLRSMDCAVRLSPTQARAEARRWPADNWQSAFKQGVLLANGNVTPVERRQFMLRLDTFSASFPSSVRPLIQLWREDQMGLLQLSEERTRYHHLQQTSDAELDALRQHQLKLNAELNVTRRKLESLTDIERQLSSRRSPDSSDNSHSEKSDGTETATPATTSEDAAQP
ncbi:two-component system QseEF-associated lipoprotein QseG [Erwinia pyri]|uniref:Two-component system QseEF-associated lipoprotein QseG n=1 Tax=Erwinia pyri TaxID=3062598 RepID=A0AA50HM62_9GAMM|nr:two-component system QseEF-associated lipoprotein QseG [Erwinia sp. DE2]WLS79953.1 two-component system QseEF-associated lipoprotein QseG [Erwinia sp. DE2]